MAGELYSIIDIETTGGHRYGNRIIEIAIVNFRDGEIIETFESLIHPERYIPVSISYFTGITNEMVQDAPKFYQVAKKIVEMTKDSIFVAHNVYFDFNFIKGEFAELGYAFKRPKICTVRLARKLLPGHRSYSLGKICGDLGIDVQNRHRAMGDAAATVELFKLLLQKNPELHKATDDFKERQIMLPPNISREMYEALPNQPGVYYFWDKDGNILYVGKSKDIKKRIATHFRIDIQSAKERELKGAVENITFDLTGNDLCAQLLECHQIKALRPQFNRSMRRIRFPYNVQWTSDMWGFLKPDISSLKQHKHIPGMMRFHSRKAAIQRIQRTYRHAFGIEPGTLRFEEQLRQFQVSLGVKLFNERMQEVLSEHDYKSESFSLEQKGRHPEETSYVIVENHRISRIEYWNSDGCNHTIHLSEDQDMRQILLKHFRSESKIVLKSDMKESENEAVNF